MECYQEIWCQIPGMVESRGSQSASVLGFLEGLCGSGGWACHYLPQWYILFVDMMLSMFFQHLGGFYVWEVSRKRPTPRVQVPSAANLLFHSSPWPGVRVKPSVRLGLAASVLPRNLLAMQILRCHTDTELETWGEAQQSVFTKPPTWVFCSSFREALYQAMFEFMLTQSQIPMSAHCLAFEPPSGSPGNPFPRVSNPSSLKSVLHSLCTSWFLLLMSSGVCTSVSVRLWEKWPRPE